MDGPAAVDTVAAMLRLPDLSDADADYLADVVAGVNAFVERLPYTPKTGDVDPVWSADVLQGANMLAGRVYRRRNSPGGVESITEMGAIYVQRNDPDVAMMLGIGGYARPIVG